MQPQWLTLTILIVLSAIFSGSETALMSLSPSKVNELVEKKARNSKILKKLKDNPHKLLITILIGNNIVNIGASAYAAVIFTEMYGSSGVGIATGVMTFFLLIFGEITPKSFSHQHSVGVSLFMARPIYSMQVVLWPLVWLFEKIVQLVNKLTGGNESLTITEGELMAMVKIGAEEGSIEKQEKELIENVLEFNDILVKEVMTPRVQIKALDLNSTIQEAVNFSLKNPHSRIPIYEDSIDKITGVLSTKDLLKYFDKYSANKKLKDLDLREVLETPTTKKTNKLFREFQRKHEHIAIVIDQYGGTAGLITMEDLLEEIVGEIEDESDEQKEKPIKRINQKTIIANGHTIIEDINDALKIEFGENEHESLNSFISNRLNRFPRQGEIIEFNLATAEILEVRKNLIQKVKIQVKNNPDN